MGVLLILLAYEIREPPHSRLSPFEQAIEGKKKTVASLGSVKSVRLGFKICNNIYHNVQ